MASVLGSASTSSVSVTGTSPNKFSTWTLSFTPPAGTNLILAILIGVDTEFNNISTPVYMRWNGSDMTNRLGYDGTNVSPGIFMASINNPSIGTYNLTAQEADTCEGVLMAIALGGVDLTDPIYGSSGSSKVSGTSTNVTLSSLPGQILIAGVGVNTDNGITLGGDQTLLQSVGSSLIKCRSSSKAGGGSISQSFTWSSTRQYCVGGIAFRAKKAGNQVLIFS
jgi:hypothetical protein